MADFIFAIFWLSVVAAAMFALGYITGKDEGAKQRPSRKSREPEWKATGLY